MVYSAVSALTTWYSLCIFVARAEDKTKLETELRKADVIVLTYACDQPETLARLSSYWLPEIRRLEVSLSSHSQILSFSTSSTAFS